MLDSSFNFLGLVLTASRDGDRVVGSVAFPYATYARDRVPIDYRSMRPGTEQTSSPLPTAYCQLPSPHSARESFRVQCVKRFNDLRSTDSTLSQREAARRVVESTSERVSIRSIMLWAERFHTEGEASLRDGYVAAPRAVASFTAAEAESAVKLLAWWCFRIGNVETICTTVMHSGVRVLRQGFQLADLLAAVDCYYAWPCDRQRYPFKSFARWAKHDVQTWLLRAADQADYRRQSAALRESETPLRPPASASCHSSPGLPGGSVLSCPPQPKARKRDAAHRGTRRAIAAMATPVDPPSAAPSCLRASVAPSLLPNAARLLRSIGADNAARQVLASVPIDGPPALAGNRDPQTVAESLGLLDDGMRRMLIGVGQGDREAEKQAVATLPLWWESLPKTLRDRLDVAAKEWLDDNPKWRRAAAAARMEHELDLLVRKRKVALLRPHLRPARSGIQRLGVALRLSG
ncbi:MAG: hypothetical protein J5J06_05425 [Phycisphaerae bacterium]|nr:hypothetical protein [Phycisphaerae bacterium]